MSDSVLSPSETCRHFLDALGARDVDRARRMTSDDFTMIFPGPVRFTDFSDLIEWAKPRYRSIAKEIDRIEECAIGEAAIVYVSGRLNGERPDGAPFTHIRFIDRFELRAGLIVRQDVWNDLSEAGVT